jgi:hypothetical protein
MARGKAHSDDIRAEVIAALLAGEGVNDVARRMQLPKQTVSRIRNDVMPEQLGQVGTEKAVQMESMIVDYLGSNVKAMKAICEVASDATYLKKQSADALAQLHAELATRAFRLLEAESIDEEGAAADEP